MKAVSLGGFQSSSGTGMVKAVRADIEGLGGGYILTFTASDGTAQKVLLSRRAAWLASTLLIQCFDKDRQEGRFSADICNADCNTKTKKRGNCNAK